MKITIQEVFPTLFYEFKFSEEQILPLYEEITSKKDTIKKVYNDLQRSAEAKIDYWTDFNSPTILLEYEKLTKEISSQFLPEMYCENVVYWTSIYEALGYHEAHNHSPELYDIPISNMSSVLYLSDIGYTEFLNPKLTVSVPENKLIRIPSQVGKMIIFPDYVLHSALSHGKKKPQEKIIVSSNWRLYNQSEVDDAVKKSNKIW